MKLYTSILNKKTESLTYYELIELLKNCDLTKISLQDLQTEFHKRFKNKLYQNCLRICYHNRISIDTAKDIFQDTIITALEKIKKFSLNETSNENKAKNTIAKWLNKIAFNLFMDYLTEKGKFTHIDSIEEDGLCDDYSLEEIQNIEITGNEPNVGILLQDAWDTLKDREKLILYYCIKYNCLDNNNHLPDDILNQLCLILNIERNYIRLIKLRALGKLKIKFNL